MLKKALIAAGALIAVTAATVPAANAGGISFGFYGPHGGFFVGSGHGHHYRHGYPAYRSGHRTLLPTYVVIRRLNGYGYRHCSGFRRDGRYYVGRAYHPRGRWVMVRVDAYTGYPVAYW